MERGEQGTEIDSTMVMPRRRRGRWEIMSFLEGVFSGFVSGSSTHILSRGYFPVHTMEAPPTTPNQGGRTQRVKTQARPAACPEAAGGWHLPVSTSFTGTAKGRPCPAIVLSTGAPSPTHRALILEGKPSSSQL